MADEKILLTGESLDGETGVASGPKRLRVAVAGGSVAHDAVDSGSPVKIGGKANNAEPAAVADGDRVDAWFDQLGRLVVAPWHPGELTAAIATLTANTDAQVIAAPGAGSLYICSVLATNMSATLTRCDLREGPAGTIKFQAALAANGGGQMWKPQRPWKLPATTALTGILSVAVTDVRLVIEFFTAP